MRLLEIFSTPLMEDRIAFVRQQAVKLGKNLMWMIQQGDRRVPKMVALDIATAGRDVALSNMVNFPEEIDLGDKAVAAKWGNALIDYFLRYDPSNDKRFVQWMASMFRHGNLMLEDTYKFEETLTKFMAVQRQLSPEHRDIRNFATIADLDTVLNEVDPEESKTQIDRAKDREMHSEQNTKIIYNGPDYKIVAPKTVESSCYFGINTKWCTAGSMADHFFPQYMRKGDLFIILEKSTNKRWQFNFGSEDFMNEMDRPINLTKFAHEHPKVNEVFAKYHRGRADIVVDDFYGFVTDHEIKFIQNPDLVNTTGIRFSPTHNREYHNKAGASVKTYHLNSGSIDISGSDKEDVLKVMNALSTLKVEGASYIEVENPDVAFLAQVPGSIPPVYKPMEQVGEVMHETDRVSMIKTSTKRYIYFSLVEKNRGGDPEVISYAVFENGTLGFFDKIPPEFVPDLVEILKHVDAKRWFNGKTFLGMDRGSGFRVEKLPKEVLTDLLQHTPELGTIPILFEAFGPTDDVKKKIINEMIRFEVPLEEDVQWIGNDLVLETFKNHEELTEKYGSDELKTLLKYMTGEEDIELYDDFAVDDYQKRDFLESVSEEDRQSLIEYLKGFMDEDEFQEEWSDVGPNDIRELVLLINTAEMHDAEIRYMFSNSVRAGNEAGAEGEAAKLYWKTLENCDFIRSMESPDARPQTLSGDGYHWEEPLGVFASIGKMVEFYDEELDTFENIIPYGSRRFFDYQIKVEMPYYGWSEYNDEAAKSHFAEELHQLINGLNDEY